MRDLAGYTDTIQVGSIENDTATISVSVFNARTATSDSFKLDLYQGPKATDHLLEK